MVCRSQRFICNGHSTIPKYCTRKLSTTKQASSSSCKSGVHNSLHSKSPMTESSGSHSSKQYRELLDSLARDFNIQCYEEWYRVDKKVVKDAIKSASVVSEEPLWTTLATAYPEFEWYPWLFSGKVPKGFWTLSTQRHYFDWLLYQFDISLESHWHNITIELLKATGGSSIPVMYGTIDNALNCIYPEKKQVTAERLYFDRLAENLQLETQADWYLTTATLVKDNEGTTILARHGGLSSALQYAYPEYSWYPWLFAHVSHDYWKDIQHQQQCIHWLEEQLQIESPLQWCRTKTKTVKALGGGGLLAQYGDSLLKALQAVYPEIEWTRVNNVSEAQRYTWKLLQSMLSNHRIEFNFRMWCSEINRSVELDLYVPSLKIAFEYQGEQHYTNTHFGQHNLTQRIASDRLKREVCRNMGITLIDIPYWWNATPSTLLKTLLIHRPELNIDIHNSQHSLNYHNKQHSFMEEHQSTDSALSSLFT